MLRRNTKSSNAELSLVRALFAIFISMPVVIVPASVVTPSGWHAKTKIHEIAL